MGINRTPIEQTFQNGPLVVPSVAPVPISSIDLTSMIQAFIICNPSANTNSVFWGFGGGVTTTSGIEITPGSAPLININQLRQLYELQQPEVVTAIAAACQTMDPVEIPVLAWNPSHIYIIAATAPTTISLMFFNSVYQ